ncbi:superoxide dismutase [Criblamydia sequanensis]|uniref:superoxide dismutase n=1 Tax=Candidatus Criblamydia sequanensis CRIB-18 TaxID=1437425 RepID=A0A090CZB7_9BACT|nr:superoxide dismutase [Criblamydia sequanensis]CDR34337.1 Superoxide dismutase [Criblamydia sequanensis CRIB-18]
MGKFFIQLSFIFLLSQSLVFSDYQAKDYAYLIGNIQGLDDELLKMHFKLYQGYVLNSNNLLKKLQALNESGQNKTPEFAGLKRMLGWEFDGMLLHEYYFDNLGKSENPKDSPLLKKIESDFGSFDNWKKDFVATGAMRGIGWVVAYIDPKEGRLINQWINEHDVGHLAGGKPLLVMDVFEHAYITQFGLDRAKYIEVFFDNINWKKVNERLTTAKS